MRRKTVLEEERLARTTSLTYRGRPKSPACPLQPSTPPPLGGERSPERRTERPMLYHDLGLQKNDHADEKGWTLKLEALISLLTRLQWGCGRKFRSYARSAHASRSGATRRSH